jgi:formylglycine-generating enzyme required for sulfatase activity
VIVPAVALAVFGLAGGQVVAAGQDSASMVRIPGASVVLGGFQAQASSQTQSFPLDADVPALAIWNHDPVGRPLASWVWVDAFDIDRTEVTREQYQQFLLATGYRPPHVDEPWADEGFNWDGTDFPAGTGDHPVVLISWYDASEYCAWADKRLPTEAEWQLAALGPAEEGRRYPWGDVYDPLALNHGRSFAPNYDDSDGYWTTAPVGSFPAGRSPYGLEDAFGNAWEFTADYRRRDWRHYVGERRDSTLADLHAPGPGIYVIVRGGSYFFDVQAAPHGGESVAFLVELRRKTSGFRCARDVEGSR